ncbi:hypothetical protein [Alteriqipengyuania lutimaris]|uniref:Uncharacterized protein n=1 Tax=Alteriqipengyuania lutimaris TaxID=1538146 RepID=A0A395LIU6_9SPHN|nr:hypothetical protein [Alteriqipengyuania lutimaris]MBB3034963.1 hypothetical protein [Alteriqipengyuania lutimaris]RDS76217.1 hypothetical protein DL238_00350 [Alteriqipengyuania lutimaris]
MRVLPYFVGAAAVVAIGGAVAGGAIDTTPRKIHDSTTVPGNSISFGERERTRQISANHYPLRTPDETVEVAELRERGLYSQDRYARSYYVDDAGTEVEDFDFAAYETEERRWEAGQHRTHGRQRIASRQTETRRDATRPLDLQRPAQVAEAEVQYVSRPVVQDTSGMSGR